MRMKLTLTFNFVCKVVIFFLIHVIKYGGKKDVIFVKVSFVSLRVVIL